MDKYKRQKLRLRTNMVSHTFCKNTMANILPGLNVLTGKHASTLIIRFSRAVNLKKKKTAREDAIDTPLKIIILPVRE